MHARCDEWRACERYVTCIMLRGAQIRARCFCFYHLSNSESSLRSDAADGIARVESNPFHDCVKTTRVLSHLRTLPRPKTSLTLGGRWSKYRLANSLGLD